MSVHRVLAASVVSSAVIMLAACGAGEGTAEGGTAPEAVRAKARFEGYMLAPPAADMSYWAGMAIADRQDVLWEPEIKADCRYMGVMKYWTEPQDIPDKCRAALEAVAKTAVFTPRNCRKGLPADNGGILPMGDVLEAVTCEGFLDTNIGEGDVRMVYHRAREQWFGYVDGRVNWTPRG